MYKQVSHSDNGCCLQIPEGGPNSALLDAQPADDVASAPFRRDKVDVSVAAPLREVYEDSDDDEERYQPQRRTGSSTRKGTECPYLDTISRQVRGKSLSYLSSLDCLVLFCRNSGHPEVPVGAESRLRLREVLLGVAQPHQCVCLPGVRQILPGTLLKLHFDFCWLI